MNKLIEMANYGLTDFWISDLLYNEKEGRIMHEQKDMACKSTLLRVIQLGSKQLLNL